MKTTTARSVAVIPRLTGLGVFAALALALAAALPAWAALPTPPGGLANNALYKKGYLDVTLYKTANGTPAGQVVTNSATPTATQITNTTAGLNQAIKDARDNKLVLYFPSGTYVINDTLQAHTETAGSFNVPGKSLVIIGEKNNRPVIKLTSTASGFNSTTSPKAVVEFKNFASGQTPDPAQEAPGQGYGQMIRNIVIDCSQGANAGAIGLYFNEAQNSSIEDVKVIATGALAGIRGLPSGAWGAVNIEVEGGQYGIDTKVLVQTSFGTANGGSVVVGAKLTNQTVRAVRQQGFVPLVLVGFEITTTLNQPVVTIEPNAGQTGGSSINLIDGKITRTPWGAVELINNANKKNLYLRNVYLSGSYQLIKSGTNAPIGATGAWKRVNEYSYCAAPESGDADNKLAFNWINGDSPQQHTDEIPSVTPDLTSGDVPGDLLTKHAWTSLPSMNDAGVIDVTNPGGGLTAVVPAVDENDPAVVDHLKLQAIINANPKVFLPKGIYRLTGPINLKANTVLFGAARFLTRIEVAPTFPILKDAGNNPIETPIITTDNSSAATTHLGDLAIGVDVGTLVDLSRDWFVALHWRAGRDSMVHMGQPYRANNAITRATTNPHSLMKITNLGGGRWYFAGAIKTFTAGHWGYRILKVSGTTEPLWIYGLNLEHALGASASASAGAYAEFFNSDNIRIYCGKSEFSLDPPTSSNDPKLKSRIAWFNDCQNVAVFGHGAIRNSVTNMGTYEFTDCARVLATHITPQKAVPSFETSADDTLRDVQGSTVNHAVSYPDVVALYKRGVITAADEAAMTHN